jgi:hypothetical protein
MTSSGTYNFGLSNGEAVLAALERVRVRAPSIRQEHMVTARRELNLLFVELDNKQVNLWEVSSSPQSIALVQGTATYTLPAKTVLVLDAYISLNNGTANQTDRYVTPISRTEYASYGVKLSQSPPTVYWVNRQTTPTITFYPVPDGNGPYVFNYYACNQIQDANLPGGETPDLPTRWLDVMVAGLAYRLARTYAPELEQVRKADYMDAWTIAASQDIESVPLSIAPSIGAYYRR